MESIKRVTFYLGEHEEVHEQRTVQGNVTTVEPIVETVREYVEFDFAFAVAGERGEPPPPTVEPPRPSPRIAEVSDLGPFRTVVRFETEEDTGPGGHYDIVVNFGSSGGTEGPTRAAYEEALEFFDLVEANNPDTDYVRAIIPPHQLPDGTWAYSAQLLVWVPD